jgi:hypothetical protein
LTTEILDDYYTSQRERLLRDFDGVSKRLSKVLALHLDERSPRGIIADTRSAFDGLLPDIPYIGGKANSLTQDLIDCTMLLAFYRVLKQEGCRIEEIGRVVIAAEQERVHAYPRFVLRLLGKLIRSPIGKSHMKKTAEESQRRCYPGAWVSVYIEGDGETFDFGLDYLECGLCKFFHRQGADELTPYLCQFDYVQQRAMGTGFTRTMTLATGGERCDFRWKRGRETQPGWPPQWLA